MLSINFSKGCAWFCVLKVIFETKQFAYFSHAFLNLAFFSFSGHLRMLWYTIPSALFLFVIVWVWHPYPHSRSYVFKVCFLMQWFFKVEFWKSDWIIKAFINRLIGNTFKMFLYVSKTLDTVYMYQSTMAWKGSLIQVWKWSSWEKSYGCWEMVPGSQKEQKMHISTEPFLYHPIVNNLMAIRKKWKFGS